MCRMVCGGVMRLPIVAFDCGGLIVRRRLFRVASWWYDWFVTAIDDNISWMSSLLELCYCCCWLLISWSISDCDTCFYEIQFDGGTTQDPPITSMTQAHWSSLTVWMMSSWHYVKGWIPPSMTEKMTSQERWPPQVSSDIPTGPR